MAATERDGGEWRWDPSYPVQRMGNVLRRPLDPYFSARHIARNSPPEGVAAYQRERRNAVGGGTSVNATHFNGRTAQEQLHELIRERENEMRSHILLGLSRNAAVAIGRIAQDQQEVPTTEYEHRIRDRNRNVRAASGNLQTIIGEDQPEQRVAEFESRDHSFIGPRRIGRDTNGEPIFIDSNSEDDDEHDSDDVNASFSGRGLQQPRDGQQTNEEEWTSDDEHSGSDEEESETGSNEEVLTGPACNR